MNVGAFFTLFIGDMGNIGGDSGCSSLSHKSSSTVSGVKVLVNDSAGDEHELVGVENLECLGVEHLEVGVVEELPKFCELAITEVLAGWHVGT